MDLHNKLKKHTVGFKCPSNAACRHLWRCAIEQMLLFTLPNSQNAAVISGGGFFSWGAKFRYTGRTEREILTESINAIRDRKLAITSGINRKASSVPTTPSSPQCDFEHIRYSSLPRSTMSEPLNNYFIGIGEGVPATGNPMFGGNDLNAVQLSSVDPHYKDCGVKTIHYPKIPDICGTSSKSTNIVKSEGITTVQNYGCEPHDWKKHIVQNLNVNITHPTCNMEDPCMNIKRSGLRKFRVLHAFVPSFLFVVFSMLVSAIIVLESESDMFKQFRNLPEMINFKFQYYQPVKDFILKNAMQKL